MNNKKKINLILLSLATLLMSSSKSFSQDNSAAFAAADSSNFSININGGWQLFNSYLIQYKPDSVQMELIVQHSNNVSWTQDQYVGKVKSSPLVPHISQNIPFTLLSTEFIIRIETNGNCYLHIISGTLPVGDPVVLVLKVYYKSQ